MVAHRISITVSESVADMLARSGNGSAYVARALEARWAQWQEALGHLLARKWSLERITQAMRTLHGVSQLQIGTFDVAAAMLASQGDSIPQSEIAAAITLADEWWAENKELRRVLTQPKTPPTFAPPRVPRPRGRPVRAEQPAAVSA